MFFEGMEIGALDEYSGFGDLKIPRKDVQLESGEPSSSPKLVTQFPSPSMDPDSKRIVIFTISMDTRVLSRLIGIATFSIL